MKRGGPGWTCAGEVVALVGEVDGQVGMERVWGLALRWLAVVLAAVGVVTAATFVIRPGSAGGDEMLDDGPLTATEQAQAVELLAGATVRVSTGGCDGSSVGSGFIADGLVVTNSHVVSGADSFEISQPGAGPDRSVAATAVLVALDRPSVDLALGMLDVERDLQFSVDEPRPGEPVLFAGYGGGRRLSIVAAEVHNIVDGAAYGSDGSVLLLDTPSSVGFSGGPVVNRRGEVVAVLRAYDSVTGLTIAVPVASLLEAKEGTYKDRDVPSCK